MMQQPQTIRNEVAWPLMTFLVLVIFKHMSMFELPEESLEMTLNLTQDYYSGSLGYIWDLCLC